ncbi:hypothetical protein A3Q32_06755 [Alcanivorax sp. KX64203]|nr:hypothetical protein A3Q32_06755 [Alcanivorax sp. KX64203]
MFPCFSACFSWYVIQKSAATGTDHQDWPGTKQTDLALGTQLECPVWPYHMVDPGFERGRYGKVMHGSGDQYLIREFQLANQGLRQCQAVRMPFRMCYGGQYGGFHEAGVQVGGGRVARSRSTISREGWDSRSLANTMPAAIRLLDDASRVLAETCRIRIMMLSPR